MTSITANEVTPRTATTGDRFVGTGLLLLAAVFVALQVIAGEITPFWGLPAVIYLLLALAVLWRAPRWLLIVAIVLPVVQVATSLPFMLPGFSHPETPASFLPDVFIVIGSVAVAAGAATALPRRAERRARRPIGITAAVLAVAAMVTSVVAAGGVTSAAQQAGDVMVQAANVDYPDSVMVDQGGTLFVRNDDPFRHTFVVEGTDIRTELPGSAAARVHVNLTPGTYTFFCDVTGHEDAMSGTLTVR